MHDIEHRYLRNIGLGLSEICCRQAINLHESALLFFVPPAALLEPRHIGHAVTNRIPPTALLT